MTQFGYVPRSNSKFFPPTRPIVKAHIPTIEELKERAAEERRRKSLEQAANKSERDEHSRQVMARSRERFAGAIEDRLASAEPGERIAAILDWVADRTGVSANQIKGPSGRRNTVCRARHFAYWLCRRHTDLSFEQIALRVNRDDHTTIMNGDRRHQARLDAGETMPWEE